MEGLTSKQVAELQKRYGKNELAASKRESFLVRIIRTISEPMILLLLVAATLYLVLGNSSDGIIMLISVFIIIVIDVVQEWKTDKTLRALKNLSEPKVTVLRDGKKIEIMSSELVPGDIFFIHEGLKIPADGVVLKSSNLSVDESSLTGESEPVWKTVTTNAEAPQSTAPNATQKPTPDYWRQDYCYQGTLAVQGTGAIRVDKIGAQTEYGKIGASLNSATKTKTPLQKQVDKLVKIAAFFALTLFLLVAIITFLNSGTQTALETTASQTTSDVALTASQTASETTASQTASETTTTPTTTQVASETTTQTTASSNLQSRLTEALLSGLTIAIAMIPEEFPVILTVFLSMGAWRLAKKRSVVKKLPKVEVLGAVTTLCVDKTGTLTENQMQVTQISTSLPARTLAEHLALCSEKYTYDPMEKAIFDYASSLKIDKKSLFRNRKIKDFPFTNDTKIVGAAWEINSRNLLVIKGSPENILDLCQITPTKRRQINRQIRQMQESGLRVIASAHTYCYKSDLKTQNLSDFTFNFSGVIGLSDPPRKNIQNYIDKCYSAGIRTIMITGDNGITASTIARAVGIRNPGNILTGQTLDQMSEKALARAVQTTSIFSRVTPEHKMRIVKALQQNGEIVAMTGDGVNDAPALKQADIGIAMGNRGSEVAREAADLILLDDNFKTIVDTIEDGRRIYDNIKKAIEYIIIIHTPIALSALLAPLLGISTSDLFLLPPQIVLFELIVDPTCSLVLERLPAESNIMQKPPRKLTENLLTLKRFALNLTQGFIIFLAAFGSYLAFLPQGADLARTIGLVVILFANIFLVFVYASRQTFAYKTIKALLHDKVVITVNLALIAIIALILYTPLSATFKLTALSLPHLSYAILIAFLSTFWYEIKKYAIIKS